MYLERYSAKANTTNRSKIQTTNRAFVRLEIESTEGKVKKSMCGQSRRENEELLGEKEEFVFFFLREKPSMGYGRAKEKKVANSAFIEWRKKLKANRRGLYSVQSSKFFYTGEEKKIQN